ncbi:hypothetical protein SAMD00023353_5400070 [Rosellinia necatrix]|uniref:Uncharacterized protein n=1 Tax=Rosellinia necatrix TaxID=77044 RepID=A0A1S8A9U4_ROSNE|nr:hypothetical protein SAMD00023353_5400070 [Rosellinia necatrix]
MDIPRWGIQESGHPTRNATQCYAPPATPAFEGPEPSLLSWTRGPAKSQVSLASISDDHIRTILGDASPLCDAKIFESQLSHTSRDS